MFLSMFLTSNHLDTYQTNIASLAYKVGRSLVLVLLQGVHLNIIVYVVPSRRI